MIRNYIKIALRHLEKNRLYAFVNIFGLAIGITGCLLIGIYIWHELGYDKFHKKADRIVRVTWEYNFGDADVKTATTGTRVGPEFARKFPEVKTYVRLMKYPRVLNHNNKMFDEPNFLYADSAFFSIFSFPLLHGDPKTVLDAPDKMVISESMAKKYFGSENPIGKSIKVGGTKDFLISGIAANAPDNSQIKFDFVGSFTSLSASKTEKWNEANYITYLLMGDKDQFSPLQSKINNYIKQVMKDEGLPANQFAAYHLEPLTKVRLHSSLDGLEPNNNILYIYIMAIVAVLILLIACVNYTNLSTAQSTKRSAEISMRKVMGATKRQVFYQFISESFLLTLFAILLALGITVLLLPYFNQLSGKDLQADDLLQPATGFVLFFLVIIISLMGGAYPALVQANSKLIQVLKSGFTFTGSGGLRKSLIVFQFVISIFLIISTIVIQQQLAYIKNKDLGYNKEQVVILPIDREIIKKYDDIKMAIAANTEVVSVAGAYEEPTHIGWEDGIYSKEKDKNITANALPVDEDIVKTLGLKIIAGSDYNLTDVKQFDTSNNGNNLRYSYMLNESAVKALGWTPQEAIGKLIEKGRQGVVKAVVKDFHFRSMHEPINPLVIFMDKRLVGSLFVKLSGNNVSSTLKNIEKTWKARIQHRPFSYHFLDEDYAALYKTEQRTAGIFTSFSTLAIILACLGLFALTAYTMVQRTKEIGIRKILGATIRDILTLVSKDFLKLILIALIISVPIAWYAVNKWLAGFTYRVEVYWWVFAIAGLATLIIAFLTISIQALKTAFANPVKSLRTE